MKRQLIIAAVLAVPALMLGIVATTIAMTVSLQGDVGLLAKRARNTAQAGKALRTEIVTVKDELAVLQGPSAVPLAAQPASAPADPVQAAPVKVAVTQPPPLVASAISVRAVRANATVPPECTFRPGGSIGLLECMRQHPDRIGPLPAGPAQPLYR